MFRWPVGTSRHRALLFKVLADGGGIKCELLQWKWSWDETRAVNIVYLGNQEMYVDLVVTPGLLMTAAEWDLSRILHNAGQWWMEVKNVEV